MSQNSPSSYPARAPLRVACGQLVIGGFAGATLTASFKSALERGSIGGAILFRRNVEELRQTADLIGTILDAASPGLSPIVAVDQEGGRVARLPAPALRVPPMRTLADRGSADLVERVARAQARELDALGFTMNFAPVLDVDTNPANPVIGDRAFSADAETVARFGEAYVRGLQGEGVHACAKHFPGHGDTSLDSHLALPVIDHPRERLDRVELVPFRAAVRAGVAAIMTAHIVCRAIDPKPATLSFAACTTLLRGELGFRGLLVSDDLEMQAISALYEVEESAVLAVAAGCDALLVCSDESLQARAHEALVREAEKSATFRERCFEAADRTVAMRSGAARPAGSASAERLTRALAGSGAVAAELSELLS